MAGQVEITEYETGAFEGVLYAAVCRWKRSTLAPECGWVSHGWQSKAIAEDRGQQHLDEHNGEGLMPELFEFRHSQKHPDWTEV